jgi:hypothetical protein
MTAVAATARPFSRGRLLKWLRRIHAWIGLWGAALGLLFGVTGFLLNHRMVMKIPAARMEQSQVELALPDPRPADAQGLAKWLQSRLALDREPSKVVGEPARQVTWDGQSVRQPAQWKVEFHSPQSSISAEYWVGNGSVSVKRQDVNLFGFFMRLHMGVGMGAGWVLLADSLAGALAFLSLTGLLLWTKLHGSRLTMAGLGLSSLGLAVFLAVRSL